MTVNANSIVQHVLKNKKWSNYKCQCACNKYHTCKKDHSWNLSACVCENSRYLKSIMCDEIPNVTYSVPTNVTDTIPTNVTSSVSINSDDKKVRYEMDCYILHTF